MNINRSLTRIKSLFITFWIINVVSSPAAPTDTPTTQVRNNKIANTFHHPMKLELDDGGNYTYDPLREIEFQLQIGSKTFQSYPISSNPEFFTHLKKSTGLHYSNFQNVDISPKDYYTFKCVLAYDLEKILERAFTGVNTKAGDLITLNFKVNHGDGSMINGVYILLHYDSIINIRDNGIEHFD